jgi:hypothetical protein
LKEDRQLIQMAATSATLEEAAAIFRTSIDTIEKKSRRLGIQLRRRGSKGLSANRDCFRAKKDVAMTGNDTPTEVKIRSYRDSPICDVVVVIHGTEMVLRCADYRQAVRWARLERKSYKIPEPDIDVAAKAESGDLPLFLRSDRN